LSRETKDLTKQIKVLNENINVLTKVTAISIGKEFIFKGKDTIDEKVEILDKMGLSNELIAIITGSKSAHSISQLKSKRKPKKPKDKPLTAQIEASTEGAKTKNEQTTN